VEELVVVGAALSLWKPTDELWELGGEKVELSASLVNEGVEEKDVGEAEEGSEVMDGSLELFPPEEVEAQFS
jgi:hypothetical protein